MAWWRLVDMYTIKKESYYFTIKTRFTRFNCVYIVHNIHFYFHILNKYW